MTIKPIQNEKSILAGIKKDYDLILHYKNQLLKYAFSLGEKLIEAKKLVPHGQWENWLNAHSELAFGRVQAGKYMQIASEKVLINALFSDVKSVDGLCKALATVTEEQRAEIEQAELEKQRQAEIKIAEKTAKLEAKKVEEEIISQVQTKEPEVIEGDFKEVPKKTENPESEPEQEKMEMHEAINVLSEKNDELEAENQSIIKIFESNDQLSTAASEIKKLTALNTGMASQVRALQNEKTELLRTLNFWKRQYEKLQKLTGQSV